MQSTKTVLGPAFGVKSVYSLATLIVSPKVKFSCNKTETSIRLSPRRLCKKFSSLARHCSSAILLNESPDLWR